MRSDCVIDDHRVGSRLWQIEPVLRLTNKKQTIDEHWGKNIRIKSFHIIKKFFNFSVRDCSVTDENFGKQFCRFCLKSFSYEWEVGFRLWQIKLGPLNYKGVKSENNSRAQNREKLSESQELLLPNKIY